MSRTPSRCRPLRFVWLAVLVAAILGGPLPRVDAQEGYTPITGEGSSWAKIAIDNAARDIEQFGVRVNYNGSGSTTGRQNFRRGVVDFAASDIPFQFQPEDGSEPERIDRGTYAYIPVVAGGTAFMYNLKINGQRVTNLRLSGANVAKIFTGGITKWDDPALKADNPGLNLPARNIVPIVRSDGSGSTAQFTRWLIHQHKGIWDDYCARSGRAPACGITSYYPTVQGMVSQVGDDRVAGYVAGNQAEGAIGYVNYSYAIELGFPTAKVLNAAGFYTEPTPENVAVSLLKANINTDASSDDYLTQILDGVYSDADPRNYQLSAYSYFILRTVTTSQFTTAKGRTVAEFARYMMCQAQQSSASLGYSPMPINLVQASFEQIKKIPGAEVENVNLAKCNNPTFSSDGTNKLAANAPMPRDCDRQGPNQCATGTGGQQETETTVKPEAQGGQETTTTGGGTTGGATGGSTGGATGGATGGSTGGATGGSTGGATGGSTGGATGGSTGGSTGGTTGGVAQQCDPDTGICVGDAIALGPGSGGGGGTGDQVASATPTVLTASGGWSASQTLLIVISLLVLALVLGPALLWRRLAEESS